MRPPVRDAFYEPLDVKAFWRARGIDPDDESQRELGRVERASFGSHDHGGHTVTLMFNFGGSGQGWPSYELSTCHKVGEDRTDWYRVGTARGLSYVMRLCEILRVEELHKAVGREVWVIRERGMIIAMEQKKLDGRLVFIPSEFFAEES